MTSPSIVNVDTSGYILTAPIGVHQITRVGESVQPFFRLLARILTIFDKKYRILTYRDKRESYSIALQQNNV